MGSNRNDVDCLIENGISGGIHHDNGLLNILRFILEIQGHILKRQTVDLRTQFHYSFKISTSDESGCHVLQ